MPPSAAFLGKSLLLVAARDAGWLPVLVWSVVLVTGILVIYALARAGSTLFWKAADGGARCAPPTAAQGAAVLWLLGALLAAMVAAGPLARYTDAAAAQLVERGRYIDAVLGLAPVAAPFDVRERFGRKPQEATP
jgi:multicomponent K+:H+ antiporter subunit D